MSWDEEDFTPAPVITPTAGQWDDEDQEDNIKENWDDEEKKPETAPVRTSTEPKTYSQTSSKKKRGKAKDREEAQKEREQEAANRKPLTFAEKQALQRKVEESDFENTKDVFGDNAHLFGDDNESGSGGSSSQGTTIDTFKPVSEKDFLKYATMVSEKIKAFDQSYHYLNFVKAMLKEITTAMDPEEIKELVTSLNMISNEKIAASKKKKAPPKKKGPTVQKALVHEDMGNEDEYDIFS